MNTIFYRKQRSDTALINPEDMIRKLPDFPEVCILTFSKNIIDRFASFENVERIAELCTANGTNPVYKIRYGGREMAFCLSLPGAPASVCCLEELIALGAKKFVFFGCCGVLDEKKIQNHLIVPTGAIRDEGTSYHYLAPCDEIEPDPKPTAQLISCLERCGYPFVCGKIWTTDGIYRETTDMIQERKSQGCVGVDMEYSALLAAAGYRGIELVQFFYGADSLDNESWQPRDLTDYGLSNAEKYLALALECGLSY